MAPARQQDEHQAQEEQALYNCLCLLEAQNGEGGKQIDFSKSMFRKPNAKGFEYILYHAYSVIKGKAAAKKYFKGLWPIIDKDRKQVKEFYQKAQDWLKEAGQLEAHGHSLAPFQRNPSGPKVVSFLCDLAHYALDVQHERMFPSDVVDRSDVQDTQLLLALQEPLITGARAQNQLQVQQLLDTCKQAAQVQQQAEQAAAQLRDRYYSLTAQLQEARSNAEASLDPQLLFKLLEGAVMRAEGSGNNTMAPLQLSAHLQEQQQELQQLWAQVEQHMQQFVGLADLVNSLSGCDVHPHAIDGAQLRQCGQLPGAPSTAGLDIAAMMEAWLVDVGAVCRYIKYLAGQPETEQAATEQKRSTWASAGNSSSNGGARGSTVTPLVATSDASSHAPHLYAQLGLHKNCLEHLQGMKAAMGVQMAAVAERIQQLEAQVYRLMAEEEQRCMAVVATAAAEAGEPDSFGFAPLPHNAEGEKLGPVFGEPGAGKRGTASLFKDSSLQLVPPTPMLQQLVQKRNNNNNQQQSAAAAAAVHEVNGDELPGRLSFGQASPRLPDRSGSSSPPIPPAAAPGVLESPHLQCAADQCSPASSVSSGTMPAAALLLMSQELMDLDLVDDEFAEDDEQLFSPGSPVHNGTRSDPASLSLVNLSVGDAPAPPPAPLEGDDAAVAAVAQQLQQQQAAERPSSCNGGGGGVTFSVTAMRQVSAGQAGDDTPPHIGGTAPHRQEGVPFPAAAAAVAAEAAGREPGLDAAVADAAAPAGELDASSPPIIEPVQPLSDPMVPMTVPGSDCLSSARPRRLTFNITPSTAGHMSADSSSCSRQQYDGDVLSPGSSEASSASAGDWDSVVPAAAPQPPGHNISELRERFAASLAGRK